MKIGSFSVFQLPDLCKNENKCPKCRVTKPFSDTVWCTKPAHCALHYVLAHIPSKNHDFSYYGLKSSLHMLVTQVVKWFFDLRHFRPIFDFLKKCSFADFSTFVNILLVKFLYFQNFHNNGGGWNHKSLSLHCSYILEVQSSDMDLWFHPPLLL